MPRQGFITLYFNAEDYAREEGEALTNSRLMDFGKEINDHAAHFLGYEAWVTGWVMLPDKPMTVEESTDSVMGLERTHAAHLSMKDGKVSGIVSDSISGTEFDVGMRPDDSGKLRYYANDDDGVYYYGDTLAEAVSIGFAAQKENA